MWARELLIDKELKCTARGTGVTPSYAASVRGGTLLASAKLATNIMFIVRATCCIVVQEL